MATISKTGIQDGLTSKAEHITRIIDALDGTATTEVVATGSFTGSFDGIYTGTMVSASYAVTASHALNGGGGGGIFLQTGSFYATTNNLQITGSVILNGAVSTKGNSGTSSAQGGSGDMQIAGGASKISGNITGQSNSKNFSGVSTLTIDSGNVRVGSSITIRGMGSNGWLLTGTFRDGSTIT